MIMVEKIIHFSVHNKLIISLLVLGLIIAGIYSLQRLPIDAVPDITNNQVQVVTVSPSLAAQEVEQFITYPVEIAMANIPNTTEIRSISRFGLSVVTIVFEDWVPVLHARQFVKEQITQAESEIPEGMGQPELMPITTGLGEIYQYVLQVKPGYEDQYDPMKLRTVQDWIVKRQLAGTPGIIEVSSFGGYLKQYEVALNPLQLQAMNVSVAEVFQALEKNNQNSGGSYIEKTTNAYYIRTEGILKTTEDIGLIVVANHAGIPVLIKDVATIQWGSPKRFGAMTMDGLGEAVGGIALMLKGGNSSEAINNVHTRIEEIRKSLPEGLDIYPYLDRSELVAKTINTVKKNLLEGGVIVILVLVVLLGDLRAGLIVASIIPLAMLFAIILMNYFGISANLMSMGAIDFGIVVDGAVIIVEGVLHGLFTYHVGKQLTQAEMNNIVSDTTAKLFRSTIFGIFIILIVFVPIMTLTGIEGKMFRPMAMTFSFAVLGALLLSLTYVPMITAWVMPKQIKAHKSFADRLMAGMRKLYRPTIELALRLPVVVIGGSLAMLIATILLFQSLGAVFIPTLEEGDLAMQMAIKPGSSLSESIRTSSKAEKILLENFPEVKHVVSKIGTAEVPTDPMAIEDGDIMIILKEKDEWTSADTREDLVEKMKQKLSIIAGATFEFTQPIQLRFNELMTGAKTDIAVKISGENTEILKQLGDQTAQIIAKIPGAADVKAERTEGLPQLMIHFDRPLIARYGLDIESLNTLVRTAYAGEVSGVIFENERKFDLVVRFDQPFRNEVDLDRLYTPLPDGRSIPLSEVATVTYSEGPMQISRESTRRFIGVGINVRNRDVASLVSDIEQQLTQQLVLPPGYSISYGGEFENLQKAQQRLMIAVPAALLLIFALLYFAFGQVKYALIIFTAVPLSAIGGVIALWLRGMPFSISAGVGFIALFGVAVLNGIVLISYFNRLRKEEGMTDLRTVIIEGSCTRLRPVIMTATVAALGFLPMALSTSNGAEVQKPLATVVIGGLITATLLTLIVLPVLYLLVNRNKYPTGNKVLGLTLFLVLGTSLSLSAQQPVLSQELAIDNALQAHPLLNNAQLHIQQAELVIDQARQIPATELNLEVGQMNTSLVDYNFSITQGLGNLAANRQRKALARSRVVLSEKEKALLQHQLTIQIKQRWNEWLYRKEQFQLHQQQLDYIQSFLEKTRIQYQSGEIGKLEVTLAENQLTKGQQVLEQAGLKEKTAWIQLLQNAYLEQSYQAPDQSFVTLSLPDSIPDETTLLQPYQQQVTVQQQETQLIATETRPQFTFGYFNQSIRPDYALQGISAGIAIPFWKKQYTAKKEAALLQEIVARNELDWQRKQLQQEQHIVWQQVRTLQNQLTTYGTTLQDQQTLIINLGRQQWQNGEIDYFRFLQSLQVALANELAYLDLMYQYNQAVLNWEFLNGSTK